MEETLKEKCERLRSVSDYRLTPNSYAIIMLDGRSFSKKVKKKFKRPFDEVFVNAMNETMKYLCSNIQGCKIGYCQSDEMSFVISDIPDDETKEATSFFGYRLCKIHSICASMAAAKFNNLMLQGQIATLPFENEGKNMLQLCMDKIKTSPLYEFDCKVWNVPSVNDAYAWLLYRQYDCIRNSKQQVAQTYLPHRDLEGKNSDEQIQLLKEKNGIDWYNYDDGLRNGRICFRIEEEMFSEQYGKFKRNVWTVGEAQPFSEISDTIKSLIENGNKG